MSERKDFRGEVEIPAGGATLKGELILPKEAKGIVVFAHGSGSGRHSPRNKYVAEVIRERGIGTLLFDLLTLKEEEIDNYTRHLRFDIGLLAKRLAAAAKWLDEAGKGEKLSLGFFGSSTGGAAALVAAAELGQRVSAVVSRGGRPDLAGEALPDVRPPVLLIVGELDEEVIRLNRAALARLRCEKELRIIPGATHLFEETGTLETVAELAAEWFAKHLQSKQIATGY